MLANRVPNLTKRPRSDSLRADLGGHQAVLRGCRVGGVEVSVIVCVYRVLYVRIVYVSYILYAIIVVLYVIICVYGINTQV